MLEANSFSYWVRHVSRSHLVAAKWVKIKCARTKNNILDFYIVPKLLGIYPKEYGSLYDRDFPTWNVCEQAFHRLFHKL
jgi:hypothetical protein